MTAPDIEMAYPVAWPGGRPKTAERKSAMFRDQGRAMTMTTARRRLERQLDLMTPQGKPWRTTDLVLSTNIRFTASGSRDRNVSRAEPADPGVAFYFALDRRPHVLACDRWDTVYDNIAAIAAHIEALRGQERWGVADLRQAFAGHIALPPPTPWWRVLGVPQTATRAEIDAAWRKAARTTHPDVGGDRASWDKLSLAYDAGKAAT